MKSFNNRLIAIYWDHMLASRNPDVVYENNFFLPSLEKLFPLKTVTKTQILQ